MDDTLRRDFIELDRVRAEATSEIKHLQSQLYQLENQRRDAVDRVMRDNNDLAAHRQMETVEERIAAIKKEIVAYKKSAQERLGLLRTQIESTREDMVSEIQRALAEARTRQERLHSELIPEAKAALERLEEEKREIDALVLTQLSRIQEFRRFDVDSVMLEID